MAFDLSSLTAYTNQERLPLLTRAIAGAKTQKLITPQTGIKSVAAINLMTTDAIFQPGSTCGFSPSGTTALSQRNIIVGKVKVHERICPKDLEAYWSQMLLRGEGSTPEDINSFRDAYTALKTAEIALQCENALWMGDITSTNANLNRWDGFMKILNSSTNVINGNTSGVAGALTANNVFDTFWYAFDQVPVDVLNKPDLIGFIGWDTFRVLLQAITKQNLFHYDTDKAAADGELYLPGSTLKLVAVNGLNNQNKSGGTPLVIARASNMFYGTDLEGEEEMFDLFYAREAMELRFVCEFKMGAQIAFPDQVVVLKLN